MKNSPIKAKRVAGVTLTLGFVVALLGATIANKLLILVALIIVIAAALLFFFFWRCQACHKRLPLQSKDPITECPHCGAKLD